MKYLNDSTDLNEPNDLKDCKYLDHLNDTINPKKLKDLKDIESKYLDNRNDLNEDKIGKSQTQNKSSRQSGDRVFCRLF